MITPLKAVQHIMSLVGDNIVITSAGYISRIVYYVKDRDYNFYVLGSMGSSLAIALGLALNINRKVFVISGDAAMLMSLGTLALTKHLKLDNLNIYVLDNASCQSTGGQKTCSSSVNFENIGHNVKTFKITKNYPKNLPRIPFHPEQIKERFMNGISSYSF